MARMSMDAMNYASLTELLERSGAALSPAELHGSLCGVLCAGGEDSAQHWLIDILDSCRADSDTMASLAGELETLADATAKGLRSLSMTFVPLLPDDDSAIDHRAEALARWCHGFIAGLVMGGLDLTNDRSEVSTELTELVGDFAEISRAGLVPDPDASPETDEVSLTEIVEYVRVGAQYIFEELADESDSGPGRIIH